MKPKAPLTPDQALQKMERFCAFRERAPQEVRQKLAELGVTGATATEIFNCLHNDGFFSETRFAEQYVMGKFRVNHWGRVRIRIALRQKEVDAAVVEQALTLIDEQHYLETLQSLINKKRAELERRNDERAREKIAATLLRNGFESELIFRYL